MTILYIVLLYNKIYIIRQNHLKMKKIITILFLLASGWTSVHSQSPVYVYYNSSTAKPDRNIIRENNIAYCEEESSGRGDCMYLSSLSDNSPINRLKLPPQWSIWDFHVVDSIAVFCGTNSVSDKALLGYFHIGELMAGTSVTFHLDREIGLHISILNRIAVCKSKNKLSVMAIGNSSQNVNPNMDGADRVVYVDDFLSFAQKSIFNSEDMDELFWDVVVTDGFFVTAGTLSSNKIIMRSLPKGTPISSFSTQFSNGYKYFSTIDLVSGIRAANVNNDTVVMAAYFSEMNYWGGYDVWMHLFTMDVPTGSMNYHQRATSNHPYSGIWHLPPREMVYLSSDTALMVIDTSLSLGLSHVVRLTPYPSVSMGNCYVPQYYLIDQGLCQFNSLIALSTTNCLAAWQKGWMLLDVGMYLPPMSSSGCITSFTTDWFKEQELVSSTTSNGNSTSYGFSMYDEISWVDSVLITEC